MGSPLASLSALPPSRSPFIVASVVRQRDGRRDRRPAAPIDADPRLRSSSLFCRFLPAAKTRSHWARLDRTEIVGDEPAPPRRPNRRLGIDPALGSPGPASPPGAPLSRRRQRHFGRSQNDGQRAALIWKFHARMVSILSKRALVFGVGRRSDKNRAARTGISRRATTLPQSANEGSKSERNRTGSGQTNQRVLPDAPELSQLPTSSMVMPFCTHCSQYWT